MVIILYMFYLKHMDIILFSALYISRGKTFCACIKFYKYVERRELSNFSEMKRASRLFSDRRFIRGFQYIHIYIYYIILVNCIYAIDIHMHCHMPMPMQLASIVPAYTYIHTLMKDIAQWMTDADEFMCSTNEWTRCKSAPERRRPGRRFKRDRNPLIWGRVRPPQRKNVTYEAVSTRGR